VAVPLEVPPIGAAASGFGTVAGLGPGGGLSVVGFGSSGVSPTLMPGLPSGITLTPSVLPGAGGAIRPAPAGAVPKPFEPLFQAQVPSAEGPTPTFLGGVAGKRILDQAAAFKARLLERSLGKASLIDRTLKTVMSRVLSARTKDKPVLSLVLTGPAASGKTFFARLLGETLFGDEPGNLQNLGGWDLAEGHALSSLVGTPPGLVGSGSTSLAQRVAKNPRMMIVVDEPEKMHPTALAFFAQILATGWALDASGRKTDFSQAAFVFTGGRGVKDLPEALTRRADIVEELPALTPEQQARAKELAENAAPALAAALDELPPGMPLPPTLPAARLWAGLTLQLGLVAPGTKTGSSRERAESFAEETAAVLRNDPTLDLYRALVRGFLRAHDLPRAKAAALEAELRAGRVDPALELDLPGAWKVYDLGLLDGVPYAATISGLYTRGNGGWEKQAFPRLGSIRQLLRHEGALLAVTTAGLYRHVPGGWEPILLGKKPGEVRRIVGRAGRLYAGTDSGLLVLQDGAWKTVLPPLPLLGGRELDVNGFAEVDGRLEVLTSRGVFAVEGTMLRRLSPNKTVYASGLLGGRRVYATSGGLMRLVGGKWTPAPNGPPGGTVHALFELDGQTYLGVGGLERAGLWRRPAGPLADWRDSLLADLADRLERAAPPGRMGDAGRGEEDAPGLTDEDGKSIFE